MVGTKPTYEALEQRVVELEGLFATDTVAFIMTGRGGREAIITEFSPGAEKIFGYQREEILGHHIDSLHAMESRGVIPDIERLIEDEERTFSRELLLERKDGEAFPALVTIHPRYDRAGERVGAVGVVVDLSVQRRQERRIAEQARLFELVGDAIITTDVTFKITSWNNAAERLYGWSAGEVIGMSILEIIRPELPEVGIEEIVDKFRGEGYRQGEVIHHHRSGAPLVISSTTTAIRGIDGAITGAISIHRDVTALRRAEEALAEKEAQLLQAQKMEAVGRLAGGIAHDFNNLLAVVQGYSDLLLKRVPDDAPWRQQVVKIKGAVERAIGLTSQLLAFSRKQVMFPVVVDLSEILDRMSDMLGRLIGEHITLVVDRCTGPCKVKADPSQLEQVLLNLVVNARDAMPERGTLTLKTRCLHDQQILLEVSDTGTGMDEETSSRIFEPFFTTKQRGRGTGLGLATVYGVVTQSGGTIRVESTVGEGTTFRILLPKVEGELFDPRSSGVFKVVSRSGKVLLVEDEEDVREMVGEMLSSLGYEVVPASDGAEALELAEELGSSLRLVLTDVVMPGMSGRVLADTLAERFPSLPIVFMSGYTDDVLEDHGLSFEADAYLTKPFKQSRLDAVFQARLSRDDG